MLILWKLADVMLDGGSAAWVGILATVALCVFAPSRILPSAALVLFVLVPTPYTAFPTAPGATLSPALLLIAYWAVQDSVNRLIESSTDSYAALSVLLVGWLIVGALLSDDVTTGLLWTFSFGLSALLLPMLVRRRSEELALLVNTWVYLAVGVSVFAIMEVYVLGANPIYGDLFTARANPVVQDWNTYRATTSLGHPLTNGIFLATGASIALLYPGTMNRVLKLCSLLLILGGLIATGSRGALLVVVGVSFLFMMVAPRARVRRAGLPSNRLVLISIVLAFVAVAYAALESRLSSPEAASSLASRWDALDETLRLVAESGGLGEGPGLSSDAIRGVRPPEYALALENSWAGFVSSNGIVGGVLLSGIIWLAIRRATSEGRTADSLPLLTFLLVATTFNFVEEYRPGHLLLGFVVAVCLNGTARSPLPSPTFANGNSVSVPGGPS